MRLFWYLLTYSEKNRVFLRFVLIQLRSNCIFSTLASPTGLFKTFENGFHQTGSSYNFVPNQHFENFKSYTCFDYCQPNGSVYDIQKVVSIKPEVVVPSSRINIFEKFQIMCMFSTLASPTGLFKTFENGFHQTGSSYNFVPNCHFRKISNPMQVFVYCHSNGSVTTSKSGFQKTGSSHIFVSNQHFGNYFKFCACFPLWQVQRDCLRPSKMVSTKPEVVIISSQIAIFEKFQILCKFSTMSVKR